MAPIPRRQVVTEVKPGDVVRLRSGGPKMTAEKVDNGAVACCYFNKKKVVRETFQSSAVEVAKKADESDAAG
jgi:uncharacterized protein YodC (DUF2158 family)